MTETLSDDSFTSPANTQFSAMPPATVEGTTSQPPCNNTSSSNSGVALSAEAAVATSHAVGLTCESAHQLPNLHPSIMPSVVELSHGRGHVDVRGDSIRTRPRQSSASKKDPTAAMGETELTDLRDWLIKTSICEVGDKSVRRTEKRTFGSHVQRKHAPQTDNFVDLSQRLVSSDHKGELRLSEMPRASEMPRVSTLITAGPGHVQEMPRESVAILIDAVHSSTLQEDAKCRFLFDLFDVDGHGLLTREGVAAFIEATLVSNHLECYGDMAVHDIVTTLFANSRSQTLNQMTYSDFARIYNTLAPRASTIDGITARGSSQGTESSLRPRGSHAASYTRAQTKPDGGRAKPHKSRYQRLLSWYRRHDAEVCWLFVYAVLMVVAFFIKAVYVPYDIAVGYAPRIAKGFAQVIMVDTLFLLFPMCRSVVTFLRQFAWISSRLPLDQNIEFHKIGGLVMLVASVAHSIAWVVIVYYARTVPLDVWEESRFSNLWYVREESLVLLTRRTPIWSGMVMLLIAMVAAPMTHPSFRRGNFNIFWVTHLSFVAFLLLIVVHGLAMWVEPPQAFFWVLPPCLLYFIEKRYRVSQVFGGRTSILDVHVSENTVAIFLKKPKHFHFQPGMYLYLNVPTLSSYEWHPFTISSAPEDEYLSVHVRNAGDWTGALHQLLGHVKAEQDHQHPIDLDAITASNDSDSDDDDDNEEETASILGSSNSPYPRVTIDGPVGAPSQDYYRYKTVVFVGAGIGVTPFASILRRIVHQWEGFRCSCCGAVTVPKTFQLEKIHFYWLTREQEALTWFRETMNQLSEMDTDNRLEIHNYFSPLKNESVTAPLQALQTLVHSADGQDFISGLSTKQVTHFGRPDWKKELVRVSRVMYKKKLLRARDRKLRRANSKAQCHHESGAATDVPVRVSGKREDVGVFFCGPKPMGNAIFDECTQFNHGKRAANEASIHYHFHSENF